MTSDERTVIVMRAGSIEKVVSHAEDVLLKSGAQIYQRGGVLVRPFRCDATQASPDGVYRQAGTLMLTAVREGWLIEQMNRAAIWVTLRREGNKAKRVVSDPKSIYSRTLLDRTGEWRFPVLRAVTNAPTLDRQGRLIQDPGYDPGSGLLLDIDAKFPAVPPKPTKDDAAAAMCTLAHFMRGFPFVTPAAKAVAVSAALTSLVRLTMRTAPLHAFDAPTAGTGKSKLAEAIGILAQGHKPPAINQGKTEEEDEKRLASILSSGDRVIHMDNCGHAIAGDFLCSMLSQEIVQTRILGQSERRVLPSTSFVMASGNNLTIAGDATRRSVICRMDSGDEHPDRRKFDWDCHEEVAGAREKLVVAGLTVLRAYYEAGCPEPLRPVGSFEDWTNVRGAIVWLGGADPAETRESIYGIDPQREEIIDVMTFWSKAFNDREVRVSDIEKHGDSSEAIAVVRAKLLEVACRGLWSSKSVGRWLIRHKNRVVNGQFFDMASDEKHGHLWRLRQARNTEAPREEGQT